MARPPLPLLCGALALLLPWAAADTARCSRPGAVPNAHIEAGDWAALHTRLRYACDPGYKRRAGTSTLIQCVLPGGAGRPRWTLPTLQCVPDPALRQRSRPGPELPRGTTAANSTSSPSPAGTPGLPGATSWSPMPPTPDGSSPETSVPPAMSPPLETSTAGERTAPGASLGTTPLPNIPMDHGTVSTQTLASSIAVLLVLVVAGVVACCCWRMRRSQDFSGVDTPIPMVAPAAENEEMLPPDLFPRG